MKKKQGKVKDQLGRWMQNERETGWKLFLVPEKRAWAEPKEKHEAREKSTREICVCEQYNNKKKKQEKDVGWDKHEKTWRMFDHDARNTYKTAVMSIQRIYTNMKVHFRAWRLMVKVTWNCRWFWVWMHMAVLFWWPFESWLAGVRSYHRNLKQHQKKDW